jgi:hypothetical protein
MKWWMAIGCIVLLLAAGMASAASTGETTRHFDITYGSMPQQTGTDDPGRILERAYNNVNSLWGTLPDHIKVIVVGKKSMDQVGEHVEAFSAWNRDSSSIVLRQETLKDKKSLDVVVEHELCHLAMNPLLADKGGKEFAWMEEGTCMVISNEPFSDSKVSKYIVDKGFLTPTQITSAVDSDNYNESKNGYMQSYSLVKYIKERYGINAIVRMIKSPEKNFEIAFLKSTGEDFQSFYREWQAYVRATATGSSTTGRPIRVSSRSTGIPVYIS